MSITIKKSPSWVRIIQIVLGAIAIALSGWVIANPDVTTLFFVTLLGLSLIMVGVSKIIEGAVISSLSKGPRLISIVTGIISLVGGLFAVAQPIAAVVTMVMIITIFILIHGAGLIGTGIISRNSGKGSRIAHMVIGGIVIAFSAILFAFPGLTLVLLVLYISIGLLFNGIGSIISGISGYYPSKEKATN